MLNNGGQIVLRVVGWQVPVALYVEPASPAPSDHVSPAPLSSDVRRLVIAARRVAFESQDRAALKELDNASEVFAARVPWEDEPPPHLPAKE